MVTLLVSDVFPPTTGGSGRWFYELYRRLPRAEYLVAAGEAPGQEAFDRSHDLRLVRLPLAQRSWGLLSPGGAASYWRTARRLLRLARAEGVGMVHAARCLPEGVAALALRRRAGLPYACYAHGEDLGSASTSRELGWLARRVLHQAEFVVANSRNTEALLTRAWGLRPDRVRLLHPGVDTGRFAPAARAPEVRARLGWGDRPVVLTVGRLQKRKGHDHMILALRDVRRRVPDVLYAILGDGEERVALEALAAREGLGRAVQFLGERDDEELLACYQQCDLFALPNRQVGADIEGFGIVLLEAQACGRAVVAGASGGTAETMKAPETGLVVSCDRPDELAALVSGLLADRERLSCMGGAARAWVVENFDWEVLAGQARQVFRGGSPARGHRWEVPT